MIYFRGMGSLLKNIASCLPNTALYNMNTVIQCYRIVSNSPPGLRASLERLQLEYVDVVFANRPDPNTPMEGRCSCLNLCI